MVTINLHLYKYLTLAVLSILILAGCLGKPHPPKGDFNGEVIDSLTREPVSGAAIVMGGNRTTTDNDGKFSFAVLSPGDYQMTVTRDWYHQGIFHITHVGKKDLWTFELASEDIKGKILYSGDRDGNWEIYELNLVDRSVTRLTNLSSSEINPIKHSANEILLQSTSISNNRYNYDLFSLDRNSHELNPIVKSTENDQHPSCKMSGNIIIYQSEGEKIYSYDYSTTKKIIEKGQNPAVSPDGMQIAYSDTYNRLCVSNIDGSGIRIINHPGKINNPCWSPDGRKIAVELWLVSGGPRYIYVMNADGTGEPQRITFGNLPGDQHKHPCWSSDGDMIFFSGNIIFSSRYDIYGIKVSDGLLGKMSWIMVSKDPGNKAYPSWSE